MSLFYVTFSQVATTLLFILPGFLLRKCNKLQDGHLAGLSSVLVYVCSPCLIISSFFSLDFSWKTLGTMGAFFLASFILEAAFVAATFLLTKNKSDARSRVSAIAGALGNVGFFGLPLVRATFPDSPEVAAFSAVYVLAMNILIFTVGVFCLTGEKKHMSVKSALLNPSTLAFAVGLSLYVSGIVDLLPAVVTGAVSTFGNACAALCMIILGGRLATVSPKRLFCSGRAYFAVGLKLIVYPLFCYFAVTFLPVSYSFKAAMLLLSAAPCASMIVGLAEMHGGETEFSAVCVLLSSLLCVFTIPLLALTL